MEKMELKNNIKLRSCAFQPNFNQRTVLDPPVLALFLTACPDFLFDSAHTIVYMWR
jgi:hypothetical protein